MGLLERIGDARRDPQRNSIDSWLTDYLLPSMGQFGYGGHTYPFGLNQTMAGQRVQEVASTLPAYSAVLRGSPPAFGAQMVRALVLSQARLTWRNPPSHARSPRRLFGTSELGVLERPWPGATTGELLSRMEWHAGLAGNAFVYRAAVDRLKVLRPDFTGILYGSEREPDDPMHALDGELIGYVYKNGGLASKYEPMTLTTNEVAHWSPIPDPESPGLGQSWITPALRDIQGDKAAAEHKVKFFVNGATPNLVVKGIPAMQKAQFDEIVDAMEERHKGVANAYRTLYLTAGADATVVGSDMKQIDFKATQGAGETRISVLSRVPAALLGIAEGLQGSSLNAGNFTAARRMFSDTWVFPALADLCASLEPILNVPRDGELWFDGADMPILREDERDAADIQQKEALTIRQLVDAGYEAESVISAVRSRDWSQLTHSGLYSVQLQPPGTSQPDPTTPPVEGTP